MVNILDEEILQVRSTPKSTVYLLKGDVVRIAPFENVEFDVSDLQDVQKVKFELVGDRKYAVMFITPAMGVMTKEGRAFASGPFVNKNAVAKAVVIKNLGMRMMTSFFIKFNKPLVEHRIFDNEEAAVAWLRSRIDATP
jgi:hypothetical protein